MGMFDWIKFEDKNILPKPDKIDNFDDFEFQTKSLENSMRGYLVGSDKYLYELEFDYHKEDEQPEEKPKEPEKKKLDYHGIIKFGAYKSGDVLDQSIEYEMKFTDGILQEVKLLDFKEYAHESRKECYAKLKKRNEKSLRLKLLKLQKLLIAPLNLLGCNVQVTYPGSFQVNRTSLNFHVPRIVLGCSKNLNNRVYGVSFSKTDTELCCTKTIVSKELSLKVLGFGISLVFMKKFNYE